jgi:glycosyltransferase involved in cell wall biosynthesis
VLCAVSGNAASVIADAGAGVCISPGNPREMADAIRHLRHMSPAERRQMGESGREAHLAHYTRKAQVVRFERVLQAAAADGA